MIYVVYMNMIGHVSDYAFYRSCVPLLVRVHGFLYIHGFVKSNYISFIPFIMPVSEFGRVLCLVARIYKGIGRTLAPGSMIIVLDFSCAMTATKAVRAMTIVRRNMAVLFFLLLHYSCT